MAAKSLVTTKQGDNGTTRTLGGEILPKCHPVIECCGWVDTLRAQTALLRVKLIEEQPEEYEELGEFLLWLLHCYFLIGTACNDPWNRHPKQRKGEIGPDHLKKIEAEQAKLEKALKLPKAFIVCASNVLSAHVDVTVTTARTLERHIVRLKEAMPEFRQGHLFAFVNRLSDFLYVLARYLEEGQHQPVDYSILESD